MMSVPMPTCTVTGILRRAAAQNTLSDANRGDALARMRTHGLPKPQLCSRATADRRVQLRASLVRHAELSGAEHRVHLFGRRAGQRHFEVVDEPAPFTASAETYPRSIKSISTGPRPTLMTCAPSPHTNRGQRRALCASQRPPHGNLRRQANRAAHRSASEAGGWIPRAGELFGADFARTIGERIRSDSGEIEFFVSEFHAAHSINMASP
jgi:hypothetical protein